LKAPTHPPVLSSLFVQQKAKADNKYFAAMRTKEAVEVERKVAQRNVEKQIKVLEKLSESERNLTNQLVSRVSSFSLSSLSLP